MRESEYFGLNLVEGTDLVNPLIQDVPNYEKIDEQMFLNSIASIGQAVELKSGTVHALTRENPDGAMFRFVATSRFDKGDTFTVDGVQVSGLRTDGKVLDDGAYVINANVLCCLVGSVLTLFVSSGEVATADNALKLGGELPEYYGKAQDVSNVQQLAEATSIVATNASQIANEARETANDLKEVLVWTNGAPTSAFGPQSIELELSDYDYIDILYTEDNGSDTDKQYVVRAYKNTDARAIGLFGSSSSLHMYFRSSNVTDNGITFTYCYHIQVGASTYSRKIENNFMVPLKVYAGKH